MIVILWQTDYNMKVLGFKNKQIVSPTIMYSLEEVDGLGCLEDDTTHYCSVRFNFIWPHSDVCHYNFICENLSGLTYNADHGLILIDHQSTRLVKQSNHLYNGTLVENQSLVLEAWHIHGLRDIALKCYFWCSAQGRKYHEDSGQSSQKLMDEKTLLALVLAVHSVAHILHDIYSQLPLFLFPFLDQQNKLH